jgi:single-stranded-DNA-specific exonuclease
MSAVAGIERSLSGRAWRWRGRNGEFADSPGAEAGDLVAQLLLARGVAAEDLARHRAPTLRAFLPDPSIFRDMDLAAARLAAAVLEAETVTIRLLPSPARRASASPEGP